MGGFGEDGLKDFESGGDAFAFLVEDEVAVFYAAVGEEADVAGAGELLGRSAGRGVRRVVCAGGSGRVRDNGVEVVGDERFVGDEKEEREFFEDGYLGDVACLDGLEGLLAIESLGKGRRWGGITLAQPLGLL